MGGIGSLGSGGRPCRAWRRVGGRGRPSQCHGAWDGTCHHPLKQPRAAAAGPVRKGSSAWAELRWKARVEWEREMPSRCWEWEAGALAKPSPGERGWQERALVASSASCPEADGRRRWRARLCGVPCTHGTVGSSRDLWRFPRAVGKVGVIR